MLTWAIVYYSIKSKGYNGLWFLAAMLADCTIVYYFASAIAGKTI